MTSTDDRSKARLLGALLGSFLFYQFLALMSVNQGPQGSVKGWIIFGSFLEAVWVVLAILQIRWWSAGKRFFYRPPYAVLLWMLVIAFSIVGVASLLIPPWRRWLLRITRPDDPEPRTAFKTHSMND
jgi:hypothetical protein